MNCNISSPLQSFTQFLSSSFSSLEVVYFDSYLSLRDEEGSSIDANNVRQKLVSNEFNVPNDACFHSQVLYIATGCKNNVSRSIPPGNPSKITRLNSVPKVKAVYFQSDEDILSVFIVLYLLLSCSFLSLRLG